MSDISDYADIIKNNSKGEAVRDAMINAAEAANNKAANALLLGGKDPSTYATTDYVQQMLSGKQEVLTFDEKPTEGSTNPVTSDGIWQSITLIGNALDEING